MRHHFIKILIYSIVLALALLPAINILYILANTGANSPSNDYLRTINLIDRILSGDYAWQNYFHDTLENYYHSFAVLILVRLFIIKLTSGSIYAEIYIGYSFALIKVILLYLLIAPGIQARFRLWLWPILAALVFSTSQISAYTYGITSLQHGLIQIGVLGGILALTRFRGSWGGIIGMIAGGLIASWSGGGGLICWPIFLLCLLFLKYRNYKHYLFWGAGVVLGFWPYVAYGVLGKTNSLLGLSPERFQFIITGIGYPFLNQIGFGGLATSPSGFIIGVLALGISILGIALLILQRKHALEGWHVPVLLMTWGVLNAIQTGFSRRFLAPWYTTSFMLFWIGLTGLSLIYLTNHDFIQTDWFSSNKTLKKVYIVWAVFVLLSISVLYITSNLTYRDKSFYLASRSPASASCLRNYRTAPTYCEELVYQWGIGNPTFLATLAWPLEKHQLSVFAPQQQWTLQGDYVLGKVSSNRTDMWPEIAWLDPETDRPAGWNDYHHLNLLIPAANTITWEVTLPAAINQATLTTAIKAASSNNEELESAGLQINIETQHESPRSLYSQTVRPDQTRWQNISIPLAEFAGQTIKLLFDVEPSDNEPASAILRYPVINLNLDSVAAPRQDPAIVPSNTDLSPDFLPPTLQDVLLDTNIPDHWTVSGAEAVQGLEQTWTLAADPAFAYNQQLDICINDYEKFYMRLGVSEDIIPRAAQVFYRLDHQTDMETWQSFWIPLLADGSVHSYTYDLRLLPLPPNARISGIRLDPVTNGNPNGKNQVKFEGVGFLREPNSNHINCNE